MTSSRPVRVPLNRLKLLRESSRLTQDEVGRILGCDYTTVSRHESSSRSLDERSILAYAKLYKVKTYEIFIDPEDLRRTVADSALDELDIDEEDLESEFKESQESPDSK